MIVSIYKMQSINFFFRIDSRFTNGNIESWTGLQPSERESDLPIELEEIVSQMQ